MGVHIIKLPDVGEGVAEAEFVELHVKPGDAVAADDTLADVMTDKATVEIPSPVSGTILWIGPAIGDVVAVGSEVIKLEVTGAGNSDELANAVAQTAPVATAPAQNTTTTPTKIPATKATPSIIPTPSATRASHVRLAGERPLASPAVRKRAHEHGIDLVFVPGSGPAGRISHEDLDQFIASGGVGVNPNHGTNNMAPDLFVKEIKIIGLRRKIAEKMQDAKRRIPHFAYVEETDVSALEDLRKHLNATKNPDQAKLTILPFIMRALVLALKQFPQMNARFDDDHGVVHQYGGAHLGIATQTDNGLIVPVVRHAEANDLWANATEIKRLAEAARNGTATRDELQGSTITITSLGPLGGIVTTPVINHPEVAIIGINKMMTRPVYNDAGQLVPRKIMNLSSSFDHRVVDGYNAAEFVQRIKAYLEYPATLFMDI